ncbi:hypothetical protein Ancab_028748 [Ancistrocladus abbreviatus]
MGAAMEFEEAGAEIAKSTEEQSLWSPSPMLGADREGPSSRKGIKNVVKGYNDEDVFWVSASLEVVPDSLESKQQSRPNICK